MLVFQICYLISGLGHPFALDNFNDMLFWTDWRLNGIRGVNKFNISSISTLKGHLIAPMGIKVFHQSRQPKGKSLLLLSIIFNQCI